MSNQTNNNAILAFALLALFLFSLLPAGRPLLSFGLLLLLAIAITVGIYSLQPQPKIRLTLGLLILLSVLASGIILQLLPQQTDRWIFFLLVGGVLVAVLRAFAALLEGHTHAFVLISLTLETAAYALWMALSAALRLTSLSSVAIFLLLWLAGMGFLSFVLELRNHPQRQQSSFVGGLLLAQLGTLTFYLPLNALEYTVLITSLFHFWLSLSAYQEEKPPWHQFLRAALWLPFLLTMAVFWWQQG